MAYVYPDATITPTKPEVLAGYVPGQSWGAAEFVVLGSYRFDDPAGEVGLEVLLLETPDGRVLQAPMTFRGAPRDGVAELAIVEHTALGTRWFYEGCADPVFAAALARTIRAGGTQAAFVFDRDGVRHERQPAVTVQGSGAPDAPEDAPAELTGVRDEDGATVLSLGGHELTVLRVLGSREAPAGAATLTGRWPGSDRPALLAYLD